MAADPDGAGYWLVARDGGVFSFDAPFYGSGVGQVRPGGRVVGMAADPAGTGYWLATANGKVLAFGAAAPAGDAADAARSIAAIAANPTGRGYWLAARRLLPDPPGAVLLSGGTRVAPDLVASCWKRPIPGGVVSALCFDAFGGSPPVLDVRRGETVTVAFDPPADPSAMLLLLFEGRGQGEGSPVPVILGSTIGFRADFPRGLHQLSLVTYWPNGDAFYDLLVRVR